MTGFGIPLLHGTSIPPLGLGTWPLEGDEAHAVVLDALQVGYRLVDTSHNYGNEEPVGRAIRESDVPRDQIFVTSKFNKEDHSFDGARRAYDESLARTELEYLDLFLIHWPVPRLDRYVDAWRGLVKLREEGRVGAIGVSNFKPAHIQRLIAATGYVPDVDQVQLSVDIARRETRSWLSEHGIRVEGWSPLGRGGPLLAEPTVLESARRHDKSAAQVVLRWQVQQGIIPIPRAETTAYLRENLDVFDFELGADEMSALGLLDRGESAARDSDAPQNGH